MNTIEDLKQVGAIYFANIQEGFDQYEHETLTLKAEEAYRMLKELMEENSSSSYVDFYYYAIPEEARNKVKEVLTDSELAYLDRIYREPEEVIFPLDDTLLQITVKLNALEMLFSTFYFTKIKSTWWGNYNGQYEVFRLQGETK